MTINIQRMQDLAHEIVRLQGELDREIESRRRAFGVELTGRIVGFEHGVLDAQRRLKVSVLRFVARSDLVSIVTAPVIYSLIVSVAIHCNGSAITACERDAEQSIMTRPRTAMIGRL